MPFVKGKSGNPGGRRKQDEDITALAKAESPEAMARIIDRAQKSPDEKMRHAADLAILERAYGKPAQSMAISGKLEVPFIFELGAHVAKRDPEKV